MKMTQCACSEYHDI